MDHTRDPCPWVALSDFGGAFCMGVCNQLLRAVDDGHLHIVHELRLTDILLQAIGGAVWHGVKGFRNSPYGERRIGALTAIKARAPVLVP